MERFWKLSLGITLLAVATSSVARAQSAAQAGAPATTPPTSTVPRSVPFNGQVLTPKGEARTGSVLLTFGLYSDQKDGTPVWTEQQLVTLDNDGRYAVILGSASAEGLPADAFAAGTPRWLGVQVAGDQEQPRFMLLSVPYALKAGDADTIAGKPATEFVLSSNLGDSVKSAMKESKDVESPSNPAVTTNALVKFANSGGTLTESSTVDAGGRIGIQVAAPISELDIAGFGSTTSITLRNGPYAADAIKLASVDGSLRIGSATTANLINLIGPNVGIGTTSPDAKLSISATGAGARVLHLGTERAWVFRQLGTGAGTALELTGADPANNNKNFVINTAGGVGIGTGTTAPQAELQVIGDVKLGSSGQFFATGGEENLRIVRGVINEDGSIIRGSGFQSTRNVASNGAIDYTITFVPAFSAAPSVTVTGFFGKVTIALTEGAGVNETKMIFCDPNASTLIACQTVAQPFHFIAIGPR